MTAFQQKDQGLMSYPSGGWQRVAFKAPLVLWRLGLGPLIGWVLMLITTTGRKSGLPRHTMVEYHRLDGKKYAPCAFCPRSQWYKNIVADPRVTVQTTDGVEPMMATRVTDDEELVAVYELFMRRDPILMQWYLDSLGIQPHHTDVLAKKDRIYWIRFDPTDEPTPPPLEADLKWMWPAALGSVLGLWLLRRR